MAALALPKGADRLMALTQAESAVYEFQAVRIAGFAGESLHHGGEFVQERNL
jgi:hypothetical protein